MRDPRLRLREAIKEGNVAVVKRILRRFPQYLKNVDTHNGWSSLHYAGFYGHYIICVHLVNLGHDRDEISLNFENNAPIHTTVQSGNHQTLLMILQSFPTSINMRGHKLRTPIHMSAILNFSNCVDMLIEKGANVNVVDSDGNTPLHLALMYGSKSCIRSLMIHNSQIDIRNSDGWLPIEVARDFATKKYFESLKSDIVAGKYKPSQIIDLNKTPASASYKTSSYSTMPTSTASSTSLMSQPVFQKISRTSSELDVKDSDYNDKPAFYRKHSNSLPTSAIKEMSNIQEDFNHSSHSDSLFGISGSSSSTDLKSMQSPMFPPSIPPAPNSGLPSPKRQYDGNSSGNTSPLKPIGFSAVKPYRQPVAERRTRQYRLDGIDFSRTRSSSQSSSNETKNLEPKMLDMVTPVSIHSSSSLNSPESESPVNIKQNLISSRSRASSIQNMINTPGRIRSNTILSYSSNISDGKQGTSSSTPKSHQNGFFHEINRSFNSQDPAIKYWPKQDISQDAPQEVDNDSDPKESTQDTSLGTHIISHSDSESGSEDSGTDVDSSEDDELSPSLYLEDQQNNSAEDPRTQFQGKHIPTFNIIKQTPPDQSPNNIKTNNSSHLRNPQNLDLNISDTSAFVNDKLRLAGGIRNPEEHRELAQFYSPNLGGPSAGFRTIDEVSSGHLLSPRNGTFDVNPFTSDNKDVLSDDMSGGILTPKEESTSPEGKRASILAVPIMGASRRPRADQL